MNSYSSMAQLYDELMNDVDYHKWYEYIDQILKKKELKPRNILEMACGTGNFTEILCNNDYNVTCFDLSDEMLVVAYEKLRKFNNVTILKQNMINFKINESFDMVLSICDSINYITKEQDLINTFDRVYRHLNDNGIFIFDINSKYKLENIIAKNIFVNDYEDVFYTWESEYENQNSIINFYLTFFVKEGDLYNRFDEVHTQRVYSTDEILAALYKAGFKKIEVFEAFTFDEPNSKSHRLNFIAHKI